MGAWPAHPPSLGIAAAVAVTAVLSVVPLWASGSQWGDVCQEPLCAGPSREELSGQVGRGVLSQPALPRHTPAPDSGSEPQPGGCWARLPPLPRPGSLCLLSPQGSWGAGRWLGARAHLSVTLESRCTGAVEPLLTSRPQRRGPTPDWREPPHPLLGGFMITPRVWAQGGARLGHLSVQLMGRAGFPPRTSQTTETEPRVSRPSHWGTLGFVWWQGRGWVPLLSTLAPSRGQGGAAPAT